MAFLPSLTLLAALAAAVGLLAVHWLSPLDSATVAVGTLYLALVRAVR